MKIRYLTKMLCLALVCVMSVSLFPFRANAAPIYVPDFIRHQVDRKSVIRVAEVDIRGIKFIGKIRNPELTQSILDDFIREAMDYYKLDEAGINKLNQQIMKMLEVTGFSQKDMAAIKNNFISLASLAAGGAAGAGITAAQTLYNLIKGNYAGAATGLPGVDWASGGCMIAEEWTKNQKKFNQISDGLEATRKLRNFYGYIDDLIRKWCDENRKSNVILFYDVKAPKQTFRVNGVECTEEWTLNMVLNFKEKVNSNDKVQGGHLEGVYTGDYAITITYDLSNLADKLSDLILSRQWPMISMFVDDNKSFNITAKLPDPGKLKGTRTLKGTATAKIANDIGMITPSQSSDVTDGMGSPTLVTLLYDPKDENHPNLDFDFTISMEKEGLKITHLDDGSVYTMPWDFSKRGDNAKDGWNLNVTPRK